MSSQDIIGRANTAELDVVLGTAKEAARIPLPPSLSLTSTASASASASASVASASVKTEYLSKKSDSRDEKHHADVVVDSSMREGAEVMSELPRSRSNMSALSSKSSMGGEPKVPSRTSSKVAETDSLNEAPMLSCSSSKISHKSSVEASPSLEAVPSKLSTSKSMTSKASNASLRKESGSNAEVDQASLGVPNSMSMSSQKSSKSKGGSVKGIPLALTKSRSTQSSKSGSIHQKHSLTSTTVSMSRSTSSTNSKVPVVEGTHGDSPVEMPVSHSNSMQSVEAVPKLSTSNSMTSKASKASLRSLKSKASNASLRKGSGSQAEVDQASLGVPNSMSLSSQKSSKGGSVKGIPLVPKLSASNSMTSKASNALLGKGSVSQEEGDQVPLGVPNSMSMSSQKSSKGGSVKGIPLALTKSRSTQSSKSGSSSKQQEAAAAAVNNTLSHSTSTTVSMSRSTSSTNSKVPVEGTYGDSPVVMSSPSLEAVPSKLSTSHSLTSKASNASLRKGSASHAEVDQVSLDVPKSMSLSSQKSSKVGSVNGIPFALTKSRSTQSSNSRSSKQQEAAAAKSISPTSTAVSMSRSTSSTNPKNISPTVGNTVTASTTVSMSRSTSSTNSKHISSTVGNTVTASTTATSPTSSTETSPTSTAVSMSRSTSSTNSKNMPTTTVSMSRSTSNSNIPVNGMRAAICSLAEMPVSKSNSMQRMEAVQVQSSDSKNEIASEAVATPSSKLVTALSGNVLWRIMNGQMPGEESLEDESPMPPAVHPTVSISSSKESPEERAAAGLPPRACAAVAEAEDKTLAAQVEMKLSQEDGQVKESTSALTERAGNRKLREAEEAIWDNSIEVSFSDMGTVMDMKSSPSEEALASVEEDEKATAVEGDEKAVGDSSSTPVADVPRKKGKWSSKLKKIFSGKSGSTNVVVKEKKEKSTPLRKRFQKKKLDKKEHQGEDTTLLGETADNTTEVQEPTGEGILGEFAWAIEYVSTGNISGELEKEEDAALNEPELEAAGETSALVVPTVDCPVSDKSTAALDNHVLCSKPEWDEAMCNFQEVKEAMFALAGKWSWNTNNPKEAGWVIPQTPLDENKATVIFAAAKQLYSQRELIKEKSADLKEQEKLAHEAQDVMSYQAALEKSGLLVKELSDAKIMEDVSFKSVKTLFNSLTKQERGYAVMLGDDVARAAKEVEALNCDAVVEVELRLPEA